MFLFQKNEYFLEHKDFMDIFGGHCKIGLYLGIISMFLGSFIKVKVLNGNIFGGLLKLKIFLSMPDISGI